MRVEIALLENLLRVTHDPMFVSDNITDHPYGYRILCTWSGMPCGSSTAVCRVSECKQNETMFGLEIWLPRIPSGDLRTRTRQTLTIVITSSSAGRTSCVPESTRLRIAAMSAAIVRQLYLRSYTFLGYSDGGTVSSCGRANGISHRKTRIVASPLLVYTSIYAQFYQVLHFSRASLVNTLATKKSH